MYPTHIKKKLPTTFSKILIDHNIGNQEIEEKYKRCRQSFFSGSNVMVKSNVKLPFSAVGGKKLFYHFLMLDS